MKRFPVAIVATLALAATLAVAGSPADPRPHVLILGDGNIRRSGDQPPWPVLLQAHYPQWRVSIDGADGRFTVEMADHLDKVLAPHQPAQAVVLLLGQGDTMDRYWASAGGAETVGGFYRELIANLRKHPKTMGARVVLLTPAPIVDARLDAWHGMREYGKRGEEASREFASMVRAVATETKLPCVDLYAKAWADKDARGPGLAAGGRGFALQNSAAERVYGYVGDRIARALDGLDSADPEAYAAWKRVRAADEQLDRILAETCSGEPATGATLKPLNEGERKLDPHHDFAIPAELLRGEWLSVIVSPVEQYAGFSPGDEMPGGSYGGPQRLEVQTDAGVVAIPANTYDWSMIAEHKPDGQLPRDSYTCNAHGKYRQVAVASNADGKRIRVLTRFPLAALQGRKVTGATMVLPGPFPISIPREQMKAPEVRPLVGPDADWRPALATWKTRDGRIGWTGGTIDKAARRKAVETFLATDPPAPVATRARAKLKEAAK